MIYMSNNENEYSEYDNLADEIEQVGYAIFSRIRNQISGYYPNKFPEYSQIAIEDLKVGDVVVFRAFSQSDTFRCMSSKSTVRLKNMDVKPSLRLGEKWKSNRF